MTFFVKDYSPDLDLKPFYSAALEQGWFFHTTPRLFQSFGEPVAKSWVVYQDDIPIGVFGTRSLQTRTPFKDQPVYRIFTNFCVVKYNTDSIPVATPKSFYFQHQNFVSQIICPTTFNWLSKNVEPNFKTYITIEDGKPYPYNKGYKKMNRGWEMLGLIKEVDTHYWDDRRALVFEFDYRKFLQQYETCPKWDVYFPS